MKRGTENKVEIPYAGPYEVLDTFDNGTVRIQKGIVTDTVNLRRLTPFHEPTKSSYGGECNRPKHPRQKSPRFHS